MSEQAELAQPICNHLVREQLQHGSWGMFTTSIVPLEAVRRHVQEATRKVMKGMLRQLQTS